MRTGRHRRVTAPREAPAPVAADGTRDTVLPAQQPPPKDVEHLRCRNGTVNATGPDTGRPTHRAHERSEAGEGPAATQDTRAPERRGPRILPFHPEPEATHSTAGGRS
ncbi:hypothetical protein [Streptomyces flavalbus]|uniref:Uncharacterized protein n=1 Tax=Streptomyces flavalbus TaxID=2665155 RepID=A0ABW2WLQ2_9ACTN